MKRGASRNSGDDERGKLESLGCRAPSTWLLLDLQGPNRPFNGDISITSPTLVLSINIRIP